MALTSGEPAPVEQAVEVIRERGVREAARQLAAGLRARLRHGELSILPVALGLIVIWTFFELRDPYFLTPRNMTNLILQIAVTGTIAIGVVLVLLLGEIDLSVGSVAGVTAAVLGILISVDHVAWWLAVLVMLGVGAAIGVFHGFWSAIVGVPSFVVTLAGLLGWLGFQLHVLGSLGTVNVVDPNILNLTTAFVPDYLGWVLAVAVSLLYAGTRALEGRRRSRNGLPAMPATELAARTLGLAVLALLAVFVLNQWRGVPTAGLILLGLVLVFAWISGRTRYGRYIYAVGGNAEAARRAGVNVAAIRISVFMLCSLLAALGGLLAVSRGSAAGTQTGGGTLLLEAIAAAVIGGTSLFGGRGTVWAALLGALVIGSVSNGLDLTGEPADVKYIVQGGILLLAVTIDAFSRRGRAAAGR